MLFHVSDPALSARTAEENLLVAGRVARLLNEEPAPFAAEEVRRFASDSGLDPHEAFLLLLQAALGLEGRGWLERYLRPMVQRPSVRDFAADPYYRGVRFPEGGDGAWRFARLGCAPYELFPCGHTALTEDGRELPSLGYLTEPFSYPAVLENGREWMAVKPNEILTMREEIAEARGDVVALGLGLGYFAFMAARSPAVRSVTVVEKSDALIGLFRRHLLPQFPGREKIRLVRGDAFEWLEGNAPLPGVGLVFADLWHDVGDGLPMYLRLRRLAARCPGTPFRCWIERDMLIFLRGLALDDWRRQAGRLDRLLPDPLDFSLAAMARLAPEIPPAWVTASA